MNTDIKKKYWHVALVQFYENPTPVYDQLSRILRSWGHTVWLGSLDKQGNMSWSDGTRHLATQQKPSGLLPFFAAIRPLNIFYNRIAYLVFILRVRKFLKTSPLDVVQVNRPLYACVFPLFMPRRMRFYLDVRQIGEWDADTLSGRFKNWRAVQRSAFNARWFYHRALFASTAAAKRVLGDNWATNGSVTPIGVDEQFFLFKRTYKKLKEGPRRFVFVGMITRVRRLEMLLDAAKFLSQKTSGFRLDMIGPDSAQGYYHKLVEHMNLTQFVRILPPVSYHEVPSTICEYDVAVAYVADVRDWKYQVTLKALEYRALGMPIIASDNEPNREVVADCKNGLIVKNTPQTIADGMLRFIQEEKLLADCSGNALNMRQGRTWADVARLHLEEVYAKYS